jgi:hypothetical protein
MAYNGGQNQSGGGGAMGFSGAPPESAPTRPSGGGGGGMGGPAPMPVPTPTSGAPIPPVPQAPPQQPSRPMGNGGSPSWVPPTGAAPAGSGSNLNPNYRYDNPIHPSYSNATYKPGAVVKTFDRDGRNLGPYHVLGLMDRIGHQPGAIIIRGRDGNAYRAIPFRYNPGRGWRDFGREGGGDRWGGHWDGRGGHWNRNWGRGFGHQWWRRPGAWWGHQRWDDWGRRGGRGGFGAEAASEAGLVGASVVAEALEATQAEALAVVEVVGTAVEVLAEKAETLDPATAVTHGSMVQDMTDTMAASAVNADVTGGTTTGAVSGSITGSLDAEAVKEAGVDAGAEAVAETTEATTASREAQGAGTGTVGAETPVLGSIPQGSNDLIGGSK